MYHFHYDWTEAPDNLRSGILVITKNDLHTEVLKTYEGIGIHLRVKVPRERHPTGAKSCKKDDCEIHKEEQALIIQEEEQHDSESQKYLGSKIKVEKDNPGSMKHSRESGPLKSN